MPIEKSVMKNCRTCGRTGRIYAMRSWFTADGLRRLTCGVCEGTGKSAYVPDAEYARFQARCRTAVSKAEAA